MAYKILAAIFLIFAQEKEKNNKFVTFFSGVEESPSLACIPYTYAFNAICRRSHANGEKCDSTQFKVKTWKNGRFFHVVIFVKTITTAPDESSLLSLLAPKPNLLRFLISKIFFFSISGGSTFIGLRCMKLQFSLYLRNLYRKCEDGRSYRCVCVCIDFEDKEDIVQKKKQ